MRRILAWLIGPAAPKPAVNVKLRCEGVALSVRPAPFCECGCWLR